MLLSLCNEDGNIRLSKKYISAQFICFLILLLQKADEEKETALMMTVLIRKKQY
jgi:hypothetical protein